MPRKNIESDQLYEEVLKARASGMGKTKLLYELQGRGLGVSSYRLNGAWDRAEAEQRGGSA